MKPKVIFGLAIRLLGLVFLYQGLSALASLIPVLLSGSFIGSFMNLVMTVLMSAWPLALAWWLIGGAPQLINHAYPDADEDEH